MNTWFKYTTQKKWKTKKLHKKIFNYRARTTWIQCNSCWKHAGWNAKSFAKWDFVKDPLCTANHISDRNHIPEGRFVLALDSGYPSLWGGNVGRRQEANTVDGTRDRHNLQKPIRWTPLSKGTTYFKTELQTGAQVVKWWACEGYFRTELTHLSVKRLKWLTEVDKGIEYLVIIILFSIREEQGSVA